MTPFPTGTVTFLFTDIEGSTRLWEQHPEAMKPAVAKHLALLFQSVEANGGRVVKTTGDGVHAVFETAVSAVTAAFSAQQALQAEPWHEIAPDALRARMGLYTGEAEIHSGDYYGPALNRAARLMAAGSGGQILIASTTAEIVREALPADSSLRDLGEHRLKDLARSEHIFQLVHPALPSEFPPIQSFNTLPNNLPVQLTSFIGRDQEIAEIQDLLRSARLVTLTGSGGTGKTRLAQEVAARELPDYPHGVWLVEFAALASPTQIIPALAQVLGLQELPHRPLQSLVIDYLRDKQLLLILDNCEHLIGDLARLVDELLHECARLRIIATSREALGIAGETAYRIPPLVDSESIQLFMERACAVNPKFHLTDHTAASVAQISARLDGIPLAIELAAARVKLLSPEQIADRLNDRFRLLIGGSRTALPRQQTLRALIDWSYDLLREDEQRLLRTASVFAGGWTLEALEAVADDPNVLENLEQLVNKSLVVTVERENENRYALLETIRQYAREKLFDSGQMLQVRDRHLKFFESFSETAWNKMRSIESFDWVDRIEDELDNIRAAVEWGVEQHPEEILPLFSSAALILIYRANLVEAQTLIQSALERFDRLPPVSGEALLHRNRLRARALLARADIQVRQSDNHAAIQNLKEAIALSRQTGDKFILGSSLQLYYLAMISIGENEPAAAEEGLTVLLESGDPWGISMAYFNLARVAMLNGDIAARDEYLKKAVAAEGESPINTAYGHLGLGMSERMLGRLEPARPHFQKGLVLFRKLRNRAMENIMESELGHIARLTGDLDQAAETYRHTIVRWQELGSRPAVANQLECFAMLAAAQNQPARAARLFGAAEALREKVNAPMTAQENIEYTQSLAHLRTLLPEAELTAAWSAGRLLTMDQAVQFALG